MQISGAYVISYSMAANLEENPFVYLYVKPSLLVGLFISYSTGDRNGIESMSRTVLVDLVEGDQLSAVLSGGSYGSVYSDIRYQTSMKGFLYKPYQTLPISWCVAWEEGSNVEIVGPIDPVSFNVIFINQGSEWDEALSRFIVPLSGVYFIQLTAGISISKPTNMELLINGLPIINVYRQFSTHSVNNTRSRAIILRLQQDDQLRIRLPSGYYLRTNPYRYTGFAGFRLYA